jgi:hypothetical protein
MWPIQLAFLLFTVCRICLSSSILFSTSFLTGSAELSSQSSSSNTFQNFPDISFVVFELSKLHHRTKLYSRYSALLVSSLNLSPLCWWRESVECCFCHGISRFNFTCTSGIIRYHATQVIGICHIFRLFLIFRNPCWACVDLLLIKYIIY